MQGKPSSFTIIGIAAISAAAMLSACERRDTTGTARQGDTVVAQSERGTGNVVDNASNKVKDMAITTELKAKLARDDRLKATDINVDTSAGQVTLRGSAPDAAARDHATDLAQGVSGVVRVDNQLTLK
ncbi:MAG: BON domain-containing protein [Pseudomonadota bacterium]